MNAADDFRALRHRVALLRERRSRELPAESTGAARMLGRVFDDGAMPTAVPGQFAVHPVSVGGPEGEGAVPALTPDAGHAVIFTVLGPGVPQVGDNLVGRLVGARWVARRGGGKPIRLHGTASGCTYYQGNAGHTGGVLTTDLLRGVPYTVYRGTGTTVTGGVTIEASTSDPVEATGTTDASGAFDLQVAWNRHGYLVQSDATGNYPSFGRQTGLIATSGYPPTYDLSYAVTPDPAVAVCTQACPGPVPANLHVSDGSGTYPLAYGFNPGAPFGAVGGGVWGYRRDVAATGYHYVLGLGDCPGPPVAMTVPVYVSLSIGTFAELLPAHVPGARLAFQYQACTPGGAGLASDSGYAGTTNAPSLHQDQFSCSPLAMTFILDSTGTPLANVFPGITTFTITE